MKTNLQHHDEPIDLGAVQVETRGVLPFGIEDVDAIGFYLNGGIVTDD